MPPSLSSGENYIRQWITTTDHVTHVKDHILLPHGEKTSIKDHISPTLASGQWLTVNATIWFKISPLSITPDTMTVTCLWACVLPLIVGHHVESSCWWFGNVSDEVQQSLVALVHLSDVFRIFGHFYHQSLQSSPKSCNPTCHLMRNLQLDPAY